MNAMKRLHGPRPRLTNPMEVEDLTRRLTQISDNAVVEGNLSDIFSGVLDGRKVSSLQLFPLLSPAHYHSGGGQGDPRRW
jgi:hypothetical protein